MKILCGAPFNHCSYRTSVITKDCGLKMGGTMGGCICPYQEVKCDNRNGRFGGYNAMVNCTDKAMWKVTIDPNEVRIEPMNVCDSCAYHIRKTIESRFELHGRETKITMEKIS
jgi:hypothetical protein